MRRVGHGYSCPRFICYIWGTEIRAQDFKGPIGAQNSVRDSSYS